MRFIAATLPQPSWAHAGFTANLAACVLNGLARGFVPYYTQRPLPSLYTSGVRYQMEPNHGQGFEEFADPWTTYARGWGDCDDLNLYRLVELLASGERKARTRAVWRADGEIHVLIRRGNGSLEDPSLLLGG